ncbi:RsmE family RNA methyltransferase [Owenweeksia hongkongensis]|uniref:RsmE family RNA methyltransferase n=1 Tax=Owenweeksia hongkongensis TaxID=253245 RepID=UPI003A94E981
MNLFYTPHIKNGEGYLEKEESHHATRVLRMSSGDSLLVTDGKGTIYQATLTAASKSETRFSIEDVYKSEDNPSGHLHIAIAPTKSNDRFEFFLEKATEIGISEITPIICDHSERKVYKTDRGQKIVSAAAKQSLACWWPILHEPITLKEFLTKDPEGKKFIAHCEKDDMPNILKELPSFSKVLMLIGPEGDFSPREIEKAREAGFKECSLGPKRLRTETAGLAVALAYGIK